MNAIGIAMVWCIVQVTAIGLLVGGLYLAARWLCPSAASPIVLSGLVTVVLLSLLTFSPWPRWPLLQTEPSQAVAAIPTVPPAEPVDAPGDASAVKSLSQDVPADGPPREAIRPSGAGLLRQAIAEELLQPPADSATGWRWPARVAMLLLAAMACRLAWLVVGMLAVWWQRRGSRRLDDRELSELIDVLCAELDCLRPIEVRQCDDLVTAATIGWRRPTLLVPPDWRTWTDDERRAVLAHEIAHARSHDFPALLCGQLAVVLHFYHPLVYWLAGRLRLEQELAADAAAASISGGQRQYLATIAELVLRQQDHPLLWPARTFLPTRNTFLRRIAMLRDSKPRNDRLSPASRLIAIGVVLLGGLLAAGLRGPIGPPQAVAADATKPAAGKAVVQLGYVGETSTDKQSLGGSGHAIAFERPADAKFLASIQIYASRYGMPQPPKEDFHVYVLDKDRKVIKDVPIPYAKIERGPMRWYTIAMPTIQVPERFYVALSFNPHQTKGIYLGYDKNVKESHSYFGLPSMGFEPVTPTFDWMVRANLSAIARRGVVGDADVAPPHVSRDATAAATEAVETISTLAESDPQLGTVLESLKGLDHDRVVGETAKFLDSKEDTQRRAAIYILWRGEFPSVEPAIPQLLRLCKHEEDLTRGMAAIALGANHVAKGLPLVTKMTVDDPSGYARRCAAYALGLLGDKKSVAVLKKALKDPESAVRHNAQAALRMLETAAPYTQTIIEDVQPDGTIRFTGPMTIRNDSGRALAVYRFINSDFVKLEKITDAAGKPVAFEAKHVGDIFQYRVALDPPVPPGKSMEVTSEGTETTLIKPGDKRDTWVYHMKHWPAVDGDTRRVEVHRLPRGAELVSKSPADMVESRKDGRIELRIERTIPQGGFLEVTYCYRLKVAADEHADVRRHAVETAKAWLTLIDQGKYAEGWDATASYLKNAVGKEDFVKSLRGARTPLGKTNSREVKSSQYATHLPGSPDGVYVVIEFETSMANSKSAVETVTPMLDKGGTWRVSGYYIK